MSKIAPKGRFFLTNKNKRDKITTIKGQNKHEKTKIYNNCDMYQYYNRWITIGIR